MNNNYQNIDPNTNLNDYLNSTQGQVQNQPMVNNNVPNVVSNNNSNVVSNPVNNVPNPTNPAPKKNNTMTIMIIVVAVLLVGVGGFVVYKAFGTNSDSNSSGNDTSNKEEKKDDEYVTVKEFSEYKNYKFSVDATITFLGLTERETASGVADEVNGIYYMETESSDGTDVELSYYYYDFNSKIQYYKDGEDGWYSETIEDGAEPFDLEDIITKINNKDSGVVYQGNGVYLVDIEVEGEDSTETVVSNVYVENGYITNITYDLTEFYRSYGISKYLIEIDFSDFNNAGTVTIPNNVIQEAAKNDFDYEYDYDEEEI